MTPVTGTGRAGSYSARPAAAPSNLRHGPIVEPLKPIRSDPHEHRPLSRDDIGDMLLMLPAAAFLVMALISLMEIVIAVVPGPKP